MYSKFFMTISLVFVVGGQAYAEAYNKVSPVEKSQKNANNYNQNWDQQMREWYYYTPQGSRLIPYKWLLALEVPRREEKFAASENLSQYGLIYDSVASPMNPDKLPIGFAKDPLDQPVTGQWAGLTCSACHTNDVTHQGRTLRIDGGPSLANIGGFLSGLAEAVKATRESMTSSADSTAKFDRFATAVLGKNYSIEDLNKLKIAFSKFDVKTEGQIFMRTPHVEAGAGRIDALGQIINALAVFGLEKPNNLRPLSAPVSYPFLWVAPHLDFVQWVPIASNPISRNAGEVLGVFGETTFTHSDPKERLHSSVLLKELYEMEEWLKDLEPPPWRKDLFGEIDRKKAEAGKELFDKDCRSCHHMPPYDRPGELTDAKDNMRGQRFITITGVLFTEVATDTNYTLNLITRTAETGSLGFLFDNKLVVSGAEFFISSVGGVLKQAFTDQKIGPEDQLKYSGYRFKPLESGKPVPWPAAGPGAALTLKAGPLLGIWATAPFLHNGSVPNLYELLSVPSERSKTFWVGNRELDLEKLGYKQEEGKGYRFDTNLPGNNNIGHVYPVGALYSHEQKMAVIEYLKDPLALLPPEQRKSWPGGKAQAGLD